MIRRIRVLLLCGVLGLSVVCTESAHSLRPGEVSVAIETALGEIVIAVDLGHAPITSANFLKYVDRGFYTGGRFWRATRPGNYPTSPDRPAIRMIQGGINPDRNTERFPPIQLERTSLTGLRHRSGTVTMARAGPDTAVADFVICLDDQPSLDFGGTRIPDGQGAAAFGRVLSGLDVARRIQEQPATGQLLNPRVTILRISRRSQ